jgi:hypothetical protein
VDVNSGKVPHATPHTSLCCITASLITEMFISWSKYYYSPSYNEFHIDEKSPRLQTASYDPGKPPVTSEKSIISANAKVQNNNIDKESKSARHKFLELLFNFTRESDVKTTELKINLLSNSSGSLFVFFKTRIFIIFRSQVLLEI